MRFVIRIELVSWKQMERLIIDKNIVYNVKYFEKIENRKLKM